MNFLHYLTRISKAGKDVKYFMRSDVKNGIMLSYPCFLSKLKKPTIVGIFPSWRFAQPLMAFVALSCTFLALKYTFYCAVTKSMHSTIPSQTYIKVLLYQQFIGVFSHVLALFLSGVIENLANFL